VARNLSIGGVVTKGTDKEGGKAKHGVEVRGSNVRN
jgi:hypothetical protein